MIAPDTYRNKQVAVVGLGQSGMATARALSAAGASVLLWDDNPENRKVAGNVVAPSPEAWRNCTALILSPGIPLTHPAPHPAVKLAQQLGIPVRGDIQIFAEILNSSAGNTDILAITGTNGKSTTTALIGHLLQQTGRKTIVGGNIGKPILDLEAPAPDTHYVLELSSYQIDLTQALAADVVVWLNISPDHLDRHGGLEGYVAAKARLLDMAPQAATLVIGTDDEKSRGIAAAYRQKGRKIVTISSQRTDDVDIGFDGDALVFNNSDTAPFSLSGTATLRGQHNAQNAAAAVAALQALGIALPDILAGLESFPGLAHRMEIVAEDGGVLFVNDSKATNAAAAAHALASYDNIFWIAGGQPKADGIVPLAPYWPRIRRAYLIGEAALAFSETLKDSVSWTLAETLDVAVGLACRDATKFTAAGRDAVVLLSPACASWDQFRSFEARGQAFKDLVKKNRRQDHTHPMEVCA